MAILVGSRDQWTQFWKRAIQIPFHQSLAAIGPVVSEEKIKVYDVRRTDAKWWQKLTWPLARRAKNVSSKCRNKIIPWWSVLLVFNATFHIISVILWWSVLLVFNATFNNISVILWWSVLLELNTTFNNISVILWWSVLLVFNVTFNNISVIL